ncbi:MAG: thiol-disulfide oxidoreductase-like protein [Candidatus Kaiserbacteria bacterium]|nr:thiol-disulfide oxidoreductase-like protein [Candidatus Kaiserbacteria bacterium]
MGFMPTLITLMALGSVALNVALILGTIVACVPAWRARVFPTVRNNARVIVFLLSALSVAGTLLLQYAGALNPCVLCWWQRVFMYPIVIISFIAFLKNTDFSGIADYVLAMSVVGGAIALYQHLLQVLPSGLLIPCDAAGDCSVRSVFKFGFVTIPWMALSVFAVFVLIAIIARKK